MDTALQSILNRVDEIGCPVCGIEPTTVAVSGPGGIHIQPCGHTVST